jgi:hypothetical protein
VRLRRSTSYRHGTERGHYGSHRRSERVRVYKAMLVVAEGYEDAPDAPSDGRFGG